VVEFAEDAVKGDVDANDDAIGEEVDKATRDI